jgi:heptose-I-phosphate ethanolaminephosphotransferase
MKTFTFIKEKIINILSWVHRSPQKYPYIYAIIISLAFTSIFTLMWGIKKSNITFIVSCYLLTGLIFICKNKIIGGGYILFISLLCNIPTFFVQKIQKSIGELPQQQYYEAFQQWNFSFALIFTAFLVAFCISVLTNFIQYHSIIKNSLRIIASFILLLPGFYSFCYLANWALGNPVFDSNAVFAFFQTNLSEAFSYCKDMGHSGRWLAIIFTTLVTYILAYKTVSSSFLRFNRYSCILFTLCIILSYNGFMNFCYNRYTAPFRDANALLTYYKDYQKFTEERSIKPNKLEDISKSAFDGTYVIVIGESLSRVNMNCYGYKDENTPFQTELKKNNNSVFFKNAFSNDTGTVAVLNFALTQKNQYENHNIKTKDIVSLLEVAKYSMGYHTVWLSNQSKTGVADNPTTIIADCADEKLWTNNFGSINYLKTIYDEKLLPYLDKIRLTKNKNLIFIHLMGNHGSYVDRYPVSFKKFGSDSKILNDYSNSIYYNDHIMELIWKKALKLPNFKAMIYFSDHGDEAALGLYHNNGTFTYPMVEIPFWMYFSDSYIMEHKTQFNILKSHSDTPFTNDLIFDTVLGIIGAHSSEFYNNKNDISALEYDYSLKDLKTLHGKKSLTDAPFSK